MGAQLFHDRSVFQMLSIRHYLGVLGLIGLAFAPTYTDDVTLYTLMGALYFGVFAMTWDLVAYTGEVSFGHALFFGVGGYTSAILNVEMGVDPAIGILIGAVMAAIAGIIIGFPALRLEGPYLSLITLISPLILLRVFVYFSDVTGGMQGLLGVDQLVDGLVMNYYVAFGVFVFVLLVLLVLTRSDAGSVFTAIPENIDAVRVAGISPAKFKLFAFVLSGFLGGLAGGFLAHSVAGTVSPGVLLSEAVSINVIIAAIFGGMSTIVGGAVGGIAFFLLRDFLRGVDLTIPLVHHSVSEVYLIIFYAIAILMLYFLPDGFVVKAIEWGRGGVDRVVGGDQE
ncbi:MAG: branched-chain amino acid ABC transporter permease [Halanaeroarchaeum sp.]